MLKCFVAMSYCDWLARERWVGTRRGSMVLIDSLKALIRSCSNSYGVLAAEVNASGDCWMSRLVIVVIRVARWLLTTSATKQFAAGARYYAQLPPDPGNRCGSESYHDGIVKGTLCLCRYIHDGI